MRRLSDRTKLDTLKLGFQRRWPLHKHPGLAPQHVNLCIFRTPRRQRPASHDFFAISLTITLLLGTLFIHHKVPVAEDHQGLGHLFYTVTDLGILPGGNQSGANGINSRGIVVGESIAGDKLLHGFVWKDSKLRDLGQCVAYSINDRTQIVGSSNAFAFLWQNGNMKDLGTLPDGGAAAASFINNRGQIVGRVYANGKRGARAVLWEKGRTVDLGTFPGGVYSIAMGINKLGTVVGYGHNGTSWGTLGIAHAFTWNGRDGIQDLGTLNRSGRDYHDSFGNAINDKGQVVGISDAHAFLYNNGTMMDLGTLSTSGVSEAFALNNAGQIVGRSERPGGTHAFLWEDGQMKDLNDLIPQDSGWILYSANSINDRGQITGTGIKNGQYNGFLLTPVGRSQPTPTNS